MSSIRRWLILGGGRGEMLEDEGDGEMRRIVEPGAEEKGLHDFIRVHQVGRAVVLHPGNHYSLQQSVPTRRD